MFMCKAALMLKLSVLWFNMDFTCVLRWPNLHF